MRTRVFQRSEPPIGEAIGEAAHRQEQSALLLRSGWPRLPLICHPCARASARVVRAETVGERKTAISPTERRERSGRVCIRAIASTPATSCADGCMWHLQPCWGPRTVQHACVAGGAIAKCTCSKCSSAVGQSGVWRGCELPSTLGGLGGLGGLGTPQKERRTPGPQCRLGSRLGPASSKCEFN